MDAITKVRQALQRAIPPRVIRQCAVLVAGWAVISALVYLRNGRGLPLLSLFMLVASVFLFTLAIKWLIPWGPALNAKRIYTISLSTLCDGKELSASFMMAAGMPSATWTIQEEGASETIDTELSEATFRALWNYARWHGRLRGFEIVDPDRQTDLAKYYLVAMTFTDIGQTFGAHYSIPHDCPPGPVRDWAERMWAMRPGQVTVG